MNFAERLKVERLAAGLTAKELSLLVKRNPTYVWKIEAAMSHPTIDNISALAAALGITVADLLTAPQFIEFEFDVSASRELASPVFERRVLGRVETPARVAVWPWRDDGKLRIRARASASTSVIRLAGSVIDGLSGELPEPRARVVDPVSELEVLIRRSTRRDATASVLRRTVAHGCCPPLDMERTEAGWIARIKSVPANCSLALQRLTTDSPFGLFVPA